MRKGSRGDRHIMEVTLPKRALYNDEINYYAHLLQLPGYKDCAMRDEIFGEPLDYECGVVNLNTHTESGSHWICYFKNSTKRYFFDSFGRAPPIELIKYLKTREEYLQQLPIIHRSAIIVQKDNTDECGALCLYVLTLLSNDVPFAQILKHLQDRYNTSPTPALTIII